MLFEEKIRVNIVLISLYLNVMWLTKKLELILYSIFTIQFTNHNFERPPVQKKIHNQQFFRYFNFVKKNSFTISNVASFIEFFFATLSTKQF